jgi:hypothetical protein
MTCLFTDFKPTGFYPIRFCPSGQEPVFTIAALLATRVSLSNFLAAVNNYFLSSSHQQRFLL